LFALKLAICMCCVLQFCIQGDDNLCTSVLRMARSEFPLGHSMSSEPNFQHSDPRMKLSICETKTVNSFGDFFQNFKKVGFLKIQISKIL
jgi:hypothetical protein